MSYSVAAKVPAGIASIGVPVASEGALPKGVSLSRATLESLAFQILDEHVKHCVAGALTSGDQKDAAENAVRYLTGVLGSAT